MNLLNFGQNIFQLNDKFFKKSFKKKELEWFYFNELVHYDLSNIPDLSSQFYKVQKNPKEEDDATCDHKNPQGKGGDKFGYEKINKTFENSDVLIKFNDYIPDRHSIKILKERN